MQAYYIATETDVLCEECEDDYVGYQLYSKLYSVPTLFSSYQLAQYAIDECKYYQNSNESSLTYNNIKSLNYNF